MIREMTSEDMGIISNYLHEEYLGFTDKESIVRNIVFNLKNVPNKFVMENSENDIIGFYAYTERTHMTVLIDSYFIAPKYRHTKYLIEQYKHIASKLLPYSIVKSIRGVRAYASPKIYNDKTKKVNIKELAKKVL